MKLRILLLVSLLSLAASFYYVFAIAPTELYQGLVQKIMYIHVPSILAAYILFFVTFFCSIAYIWKKEEFYDRVAVAAVEIGTLYTGIALITGAIWGKPTWNTYWTWDAKLTITLITFIIYVGYSLLRTFSDLNEKQMFSSAILGIMAFVVIPLNHMSVTWWRTLHQPSTFLAKEDKISPSLRYPLYYCLVAVILFTIWLIIKRYQLEKAKREHLKALQLKLGE